MHGVFVVFIIILLIYFMPSIVAFSRKKKNSAAILALNFFLGWTLVGWVVSLTWALTHEERIDKTMKNEQNLS